MANETGYDVIIIADEKNKAEMEAATTLRNKIGEWGKCSAVLWTVRQYKDNEQQIGSEQNVVFVGLNEISSRNVSSMHWKCYELGMRYGRCGSVRMIQVVPQSFDTVTWAKFKLLCDYNPRFIYMRTTEIVIPEGLDAGLKMQIEEIQRLYDRPLVMGPVVISTGGPMNMPPPLPPNPNGKAKGKLFFRKLKIREKVVRVQYTYLVCKLAADFEEFLH
jgi:hypothetical protein